VKPLFQHREQPLLKTTKTLVLSPFIPRALALVAIAHAPIDVITTSATHLTEAIAVLVVATVVLVVINIHTIYALKNIRVYEKIRIDSKLETLDSKFYFRARASTKHSIAKLFGIVISTPEYPTESRCTKVPSFTGVFVFF